MRDVVGELLQDPDAKQASGTLCRLPPRRVINPLIRFLHSNEQPIKWRAVTGLGAVVSALADNDMTSAREVMRRLMWNLNSESGGIGWGSAEAMGEIMANHEGLADEYASILVSYINEGDNYIENESLQKGVLWALGRLAHVWPHQVEEGASLLLPFLTSADADCRGLAAWTARAIGSDTTKALLSQLKEDTASLQIYIADKFVTFRVNELAGGVDHEH